MKGLFFLLLLNFSVSFVAQDSTANCNNFHRGKFIMTGPSGGEIKIKRKKNIQVERYNRENQKYRFSVTWISPCEYILSLKKVHGKKSAKEYVGSKVFVKIIETKEDYYIAISRQESGEATKIEITKIN